MKKILVLSVLMTLLTACAHTHQKNPYSRIETYNRNMFAFNMKVDRAVVRPVVKAYTKVTPPPIQGLITNFFNNIDEFAVVINDLLQFDFYHAHRDFARVVINSTVGFAGLMDIASRWNIPHRYNDLGLTFAKWGYRSSHYFIIPLLGPSTIRDAVSWPMNCYLNPVWPLISPAALRWTLVGASFVPLRADLLAVDHLMYNAVDSYAFVKSGFEQKRQKQLERILHPDYDRKKADDDWTD